MRNREADSQGSLPDLGPRNIGKSGLETALNVGFKLLPHLPGSLYPFVVDQTLGRFANSSQKQVTVEWLHEYVSKGHPGVENIKRILNSLDPNVQKRYFTGFITNLLFRDQANNDRLNATKSRIGASPKLIVISPTNNCDLKCVGCYNGEYQKGQGLSEEVVQDVIDQAKELGTRFFVISGGEPLLYKPLFRIFERNQDVVFQIYTNGQRITKDVAKRLVEVGNAAPCMSIEGFEQETDTRRGRGVFRRVLQSARYLHEAGVMYGFSATGTMKNYLNITSEEFANLMIQYGFLYGWYFQIMPVGSDLAMMKELFLTPEARSEFRARIANIRYTKPLLAGDFWNDGCITDGCLAAGRHYAHVNAKGDIELCVFGHFADKNVLRGDTLEDAFTSPFFRDLRRSTKADCEEDPNPLRPCIIIDRPHILAEAVAEHGARPTHPGADAIFQEPMASEIRTYAQRMKEVADPVFQQEYKPWYERWMGKDKPAASNRS